MESTWISVKTDLAFFPVDARLGRTREWGVSAFLNQVKVDLCLMPMHYFGAVWDPSAEFTEKYGSTPLWIPQKDGDSVSGRRTCDRQAYVRRILWQKRYVGDARILPIIY